MVGKWKDILIAFSNNYGHQNSAIGSCLKVSCNLESKTTISFLSFVALKPIGCYCTLSGEGNGNSLQNFCLENPMDGGAWKRIVPRVAELDMTGQLHFLSFSFYHSVGCLFVLLMVSFAV